MCPFNWPRTGAQVISPSLGAHQCGSGTLTWYQNCIWTLPMGPQPGPSNECYLFRGPPIGLRSPHVELDLQLYTPPIRPHPGPKQQIYLLGALQYGSGNGALTCYQNCRWGHPTIAEATKIQLRGPYLHLVQSIG